MSLHTSKKGPTEMRPNRGRKRKNHAPRIPKEKSGPEPLATLCKRVDRKAAKHATEGKGCLFAGTAGIECSGPIDPAHVYKRTRRHIRHHPLNILPCCRAHHDHFEPRVSEWREAVHDLTHPLYIVRLEMENDALRSLYGTDLRACYEWWETKYEGLAEPVETRG
jgi:hypothetical protein